MIKDTTGALATLLDFSFSSFITARIIKLLYALGLIVAAVVALVMLIGAMVAGVTQALVMLILAPLGFLIAVLYLRVILELLIVIFRIAENVERIAQRPPAGNM
jgi:hypothetical protein